MILVDKNIKALASQGILIQTGYQESNVNSISYDLTIGEFIGRHGQEAEIEPGAVLIVKTNEELKIPSNITGRIGEKNSLIRLGLQVTGPQYQPGHVTYAFLRVINMTDKVIVLQKNMAIAQIYFEELKEVPERTYDQQSDASFNNERDYRGYGKYKEEYERNIKSFEKIKSDIENTAEKIYGNVLTLMGIIVAVFSMLSINFQAFTAAELTPRYIIAMNLSITFCIVVMLGTILLLINGWKKRWFYALYAIVLVALGVATLLFSLGIV